MGFSANYKLISYLILSFVFLFGEANSFTTIASDSLVTVTPGKHYKHNAIYRLFLGKHYRKLWATPVNVPVFNLDEKGFTPLQKGGNRETINLSLSDADGKQYVARSVDKDISKALPENMRTTFIARIIKDQTSANHPYGPLIVPPIANALGVLNNSPSLYVLKGSSLKGDYAEFDGMLVMIEERPLGTWTPAAEKSMVVKSSEETIAKYFSEGIQFEPKSYLRARLLDLLIGDWSRHEGQYNWAAKSDNGNKVFYPIARDRDHAFYKFDDGIINKLGMSVVPRYQSFESKISHVNHLTIAGYYFDNLILPEIDKQDWMEITQGVINDLNDSVFDAAVNNLPQGLDDKEKKRLKKRLVKRKASLLKASLKFYKIMSQYPVVAGSALDELVTIERTDSSTNVEIYERKANGDPGGLRFKRCFLNDETKELQIHTFAGNDFIQIKGDANPGNTLKLILNAGTGENKVLNTANKSSDKKIIYNPIHAPDLKFDEGKLYKLYLKRKL